MSLEFTEDELVEIVNSTAFTAFHALEDNDDEAWRVATIAVSIVNKIESSYPSILESEQLLCAREILVLRRRIAVGKDKDLSAKRDSP